MASSPTLQPEPDREGLRQDRAHQGPVQRRRAAPEPCHAGPLSRRARRSRSSRRPPRSTPARSRRTRASTTPATAPSTESRSTTRATPTRTAPRRSAGSACGRASSTRSTRSSATSARRSARATILDYAKRFGFYSVPPFDTPLNERAPSGLYNRSSPLRPEPPRPGGRSGPPRLRPGADARDAAADGAGRRRPSATGGIVMRPYVVGKIVAPNGSVVYRAKPDTLGRAIKPKTAKALNEFMQLVVTGGTGTAAQIPGDQGRRQDRHRRDQRRRPQHDVVRRLRARRQAPRRVRGRARESDRLRRHHRRADREADPGGPPTLRLETVSLHTHGRLRSPTELRSSTVAT